MNDERSLRGKDIPSSYRRFLQVPDAGADDVLRDVCDGEGDILPLRISTAGIEVTKSPTTPGGVVTKQYLEQAAPVSARPYDSRAFNIPCDGVTDATSATQAAINTLSAAGGGRLLMVGTNSNQSFYINGSLWARNGVVLEWVNPILMGSEGRIGILGELDTGTTSYPIRATTPAGTNIVYLSSAAASNYTNFAVGDLIEIRGQNNASGIAIERETFVVASIDAINNTLTAQDPFEFSYDPTYPSSPWPNDRTLMVKVQKADLVSGYTRESTAVVVSSTGGFSVGDVVVVRDEKLASDISGTSANRIHLETNIIAAINPGANTVTFVAPLVRDYEGAFSPKILRTIPAFRAGHINPTIRYTALPSRNGLHACQLIYSVGGIVENLKVLGDPVSGLGHRGHGVRISDGCMFNEVLSPVIQRPAFVDSGQGYGVTFYAGARFNRLSGGWFEGCRHSVLWFTGACQNIAENFNSVDCRVSDVDMHGCDERGNIARNFTCVGGPSTSPGSSFKAAVRIGNTTHRAGGHDNVIRDYVLQNYIGQAAHIWPTSSGNRISGARGTCTFGVLVQRMTQDLALTVENNRVLDFILDGADDLLKVDGGVNAVCIGNAFESLTVIAPPGTEPMIDLVDTVSTSIRGVARLESGPASPVVNYAVSLVRSSSLTVEGLSLNGWRRAVFAENCPSARIGAVEVAGMSDRWVLRDNGGNAGMAFGPYEARGFTPIFSGLANSSPIITPRKARSSRVVTSLSLPANLSGSGNQIAISSPLPSATAGTLLATGSITPAIPLGLVSFSVICPYLSIDTAENVIVTAFWQNASAAWVAMGAWAVRLTAGATAGQGVIARGIFRHDRDDLTAISVMARIGCRNTAPILTIGGVFGGLDTPTLELAEVVE